MRRVLVMVVLSVFVLFVLWVVLPVVRHATQEPLSEPGLAALTVGRAKVRVEFARTPEERARGLSGRVFLPDGHGMLFLFPHAQAQTFWMKDTLVPLDFVWIRGGIVVGVTSEVQPEPGVPDDRLRRYVSPEVVDKVLEIPAGWSARHHLSRGDSVALGE